MRALLHNIRTSVALPLVVPRLPPGRRAPVFAACPHSNTSRSPKEASAADAGHSSDSRQQELQPEFELQQIGTLAACPPAEAVAPPRSCSTNTALGQVMAAQANFVRVRVDSLEGGQPGEAPPCRRLLCVVRALLKKMRRAVVVGDRVRVVGVDWAGGRGMVEDVLPRSSQLSEPAVANVDHVLLVFSAAMPAFQPSPATRYLLSAEVAGLPATVAINKADLLGPEDVQAVVQQVASWGYRALAVSVVSGEGLQELTELLQGRMTVVAGPSGAGKSSIINALRLRSLGLEASLGAMAEPPFGNSDSRAGSDEQAGAQPAMDSQCGPQQHQETPQGQHDVAQPPSSSQLQQQQQQSRQEQPVASVLSGVELQAVGQVSQRIGRGKHTTRNVTLLELEGSGASSCASSLEGGGIGNGSSSRQAGGLVVDTPGFNQPDLAGAPASQLGHHFPEIRRLLEEGRCAFRACQHLQEPGCVVREAGWERYPLYCDIHSELRVLEEQAAQRQASKKRREGTVRVKTRAGGQQGVEARLESKSHRRVSRRSVRQKLSELVRDVETDEDVL